MRLALAATIFSAAACGSVAGPAQPDAAKHIDADLRDADLSANVTVTTQTHLPGSGPVGAAQGMVNVFATLPNGAPGDMIQTDASGMGTLKVYPGGAVTAVYRHTADMGADLVTYMGVKPGDFLKFGRDFTGLSTTLGTMTLSWNAFANVYYYRIITPCQTYLAFAPTVSVVITERDTCDRVPMDIVVVAYNSSGVLIGFSYSIVTFSNGGAQGLNFFSTPQNASVNVTGLPAEITGGSANFFNVFSGGTLGFVNGVNLPMPVNGAATGTMLWRGVGQRTYAELYLYRGGNFSDIRVEDSFSTGTTSWTVAAPQLPPWLEYGTISSAALRMMNWFAYGPAIHDGNIVTSTWTHLVNSVNTPFSWSFVTPPTTSAISMPFLPAALAQLGPHTDDYLNTNVRLIEIPTVSGYDAFRAIPERQVFCVECAVRANAFQRAIVADN